MNILIALDGSANADECIRDLVNFPLTQTQVHIVVVCDDTVLSPLKIDEAQAHLIIKKAETAISGLYPNLSLSSELRSGHAPAQILQVCKSYGADLLLAGAHSPRAFPRELLGSVASHLAKHADCSVRLLRPHSGQNRVLACLENNDIDQSVVQQIKQMCWPDGSVLKFLHVLDAPSIELSQNPREDAKLFYELQGELKAKMETAMEAYVCQFEEMFPELEIETLISPEIEPLAVILETAQSWPASAILVGSHRREGLDKFWLGSVSEPVASKATCTVHTIRHA